MRMKIFAIVLVALCGVIGMPGLSLADDAAQVRALNDLRAWVSQNEMIHADVQWVLEAFERFDHERNWESLQAARATLGIARRDIEKLALPKAEMTSADRSELMKRGIDLHERNGRNIQGRTDFGTEYMLESEQRHYARRVSR